MAGSKLPRILRVAVGIRLRAHRNVAALRQEELAELSGLAASQVSRIEKGHSAGSTCALMRLAWALGVEPSELLPDLVEIESVFGSKR